MTEMDHEWAIGQLDWFIRMTEYVVSNAPGVVGSFICGSEEGGAAEAQVVEQILDRVLPRWRTELPEDEYRIRIRMRQREAATSSRSQLKHAGEVEQKLDDEALEISAADLDPWIWSGTKSPWQSGHCVQAMRDALTKLKADTQNKVGRRDVSETDPLKQSFTTYDAKLGKARPRRMSPEGSDIYRSVQRGAMSFAKTIFAGIRNPLSHKADRELDEQIAMEHAGEAS